MHVVTQMLCILVEFVKEFGNCFHDHLFWLGHQLFTMGKKFEFLTFPGAAQEYLRGLGELVHFDTLDVLGPHRYPTPVINGLEIEVVSCGSEQEIDILLPLTSILDEPCFGLGGMEKDNVEVYLSEHCKADSSLNQPIHRAILLLGLWKYGQKHNLQHLLRTFSKYQTATVKIATSCCQSCVQVLAQIVREQGQKETSLSRLPIENPREKQWPETRLRKGGTRWKPTMLPTLLPRETGLLLMRKGKLRLLERLHRIKRELATRVQPTV